MIIWFVKVLPQSSAKLYKELRFYEVYGTLCLGDSQADRMKRAFVSLMAFGAFGVLLSCTQDIEAGRASFANLCASCHGFDGHGRVSGAHTLGVHPGDLTTLARDNDGAFPRAAVLARIDRYTLSEVSPAFREHLDGRMVLVETGTGVLTPATEPRLNLAAYLESIQAD